MVVGPGRLVVGNGYLVVNLTNVDTNMDICKIYDPDLTKIVISKSYQVCFALPGRHAGVKTKSFRDIP